MSYEPNFGCNKCDIPSSNPVIAFFFVGDIKFSCRLNFFLTFMYCVCIEIKQIDDLDAFNFLDFDIESILKDNNEVGLEFSSQVDVTNGVVASHGQGSVKSSLGFRWGQHFGGQGHFRSDAMSIGLHKKN